MTRTQKIEALTENYVDTLMARAARGDRDYLAQFVDDHVDLAALDDDTIDRLHDERCGPFAVDERDQVALDLVALIETWGMEDDADDNLKGGAFEGVTNIEPATFQVRRGGKTYELTVVEV